MRLRCLYHFLTLVLVLIFTINLQAAPVGEVIPEKKEFLNEPAGLLRPSRNHQPQSWTLSLGVINGAIVDKSINRNTFLMQFVYSQYSGNLTAEELGLEISQLGLAGWNIGWKKLWFLSEWNEPFYKVSIASLYKPSETFASLINADRYQLRIHLGLDDFLSQQRNLKVETFFAHGLLGNSMGALLGYRF
jgi:hypothetical protein